jgi:hypothetical protein
VRRRNISMPELLWGKIRERAAVEHTTTSGLIRRAVLEYLDKEPLGG